MNGLVLSVRVVRLDEGLPSPSKTHSDDAGFDLMSRQNVIIKAAGGRTRVATGVAVELPAGAVGFICPRSGLAEHEGLTCLNAPGVIDPGYRGEVAVVLVNTDPARDVHVARGDRIAQLVVLAAGNVTLEIVDTLSPSERRDTGFGHSGR